MLCPRRLSVRGFRGYRAETAFALDRPAIILFGENHSGKSSTLNAIEWCLFGDDCLGKQTGIRERIGWIVPNQHEPGGEAVVELELANSAGSYVVRRRWGKHGKRLIQELELRQPDGVQLSGADAEQALARLRQSEFRDFLTTVYQHQEVIRAVLTQEPRERNDAIDRLLGLAVYRNLLDALERARTAERYRALRSQFEAFERQVQTALATREHDLEELRREAREAGLADGQQSAASGLALARTIHEQLAEFCQESGLAAGPLALPGLWTELNIFEAAARKQVGWLRAEMPCVKRQRELFHKQAALLQLKAKWETTRENCEAVGRSVRDLDTDFRGPQAVAAELAFVAQELTKAQAELRAANHRASLVREALSYLSAMPATDACPLCQQAAPGLPATLQEAWDRELQSSVGTVTGRIDQLTVHQKQLRNTQDRYLGFNRLLEQGVAEISGLRAELGKLLNLALGVDDDGLALIGRELELLQGHEQELREAVEEKGRRLAGIEANLELLRRLRELLVKEEKGRLLEQIQKSSAFKELEQWRDRAAQLISDLEAIQAATGAAARAEAVAKLGAAEQTIDAYFRRLTRHPAIQRIRLAVTEVRQRNSYTITDAAGQDLTPVLSQGDLNALALAIFLGLASAAGGRAAFGFVMLDDPSQSLGTEHKKALVQILDDVSRQKQVVLATMDAELRDLLGKGLTRARQEYVFGNWSVETGPSLVPW